MQSNSFHAADISKIKESSTAHMTLQTANIHSLPVEIHLTFLHPMPDLPSLHALIHAFASYWRVYKSSSRSILSTVFLRDIDPDVLFDPLSIADAHRIPHDKGDSVEKVKNLPTEDEPLAPSKPLSHNEIRCIHRAF